MVNKCVVNTCNTIKAGDGVSMHRLPADPNTRGHWFKAMTENIGQTVFREEDQICSKHFNASNFENVDGVAVLRSDAVPFNFCPDEGSMPRAKRSKRDEAVTPQCSVFSCTNVFNETNLIRPSLNYYPFPKPKALLTSWKQFCNKTDEDFTHSFVCSDHFTPSDFTVGANTSAGSLASRVLKTNAVPTIYKTEVKCEDMVDEGETVITPQNAMETEYSSGDNSVSCVSGDKVCGIENCESRAGGRSGVEYYPIPTQANTRKAWLKLIQTQANQKEMPPDSFFCSLHFTSECFRVCGKTNKKILLADAVPSIFKAVVSDKDEFPVLSQADLGNAERVKGFYNWCLNNHQEQKSYIKFLKERSSIQAKRIARLAKSVDDFKAKKTVSEEATAALQLLFDKIVDAQYDVI